MPYVDIHNAIPSQLGTYTRNIISLNVGFTSAKNFRGHQEDRLCVDIVPGFYLLTLEKRLQILELVFQKIAYEINLNLTDIARRVGTTAVISISFLEKRGGMTNAHIYSAALGDSCGYYFIRDKHTKKVKECKRLHIIHDVNNEEERGRILAIKGGFIREQNGMLRVQGTINLTRSFGDLNLQPYISSNPVINYNMVPLADDEEIVLLNATDGVNALKTANSVVLQGQDTDSLTQCCDGKVFEQLHENIVSSQQNGDNSTTIMHQPDTADFNQQRETTEPGLPETAFSEPVLIGVFDGHGGDAISDYVAKTLPTLINEYTFQAIPESDDKVKLIADLNRKQLEIIRDIKKERHKEAIDKIIDHNSKMQHIKDISREIKAQFPLDNILPGLGTYEFEQMLEKMNEILLAKEQIDIHNNSKSDKYLFFKDNSNSWQELVKEFRTYALEALKKIVETYGGAADTIKLLQKYRDNPVFSKHRANHWFQKIGRTSAVIEIDKLIERFQRQSQSLLFRAE